MEYKIISLIGIVLLCQHIQCNDYLTSSTLQHTTNYNNNDQIAAITSNDVWTSIVQSISTSTIINSITRLHPINETINDEEEEDVETSTHFDVIGCSGDTAYNNSNNNNNYLIETFTGDIVVTLILHQSDNATTAVKFIVNRINEIGVLAHNVTIGVRVVEVMKSESILDIIENELDYMEHCVDSPFGIFLSKQFWQHVSKSDKNYELKMWPLPDIQHIKMDKIAHLLNELPLPMRSKNASIEIRTDSINRTKDFQMIMRAENLCFSSYFPSKENIFIYVGSGDYLESVHYTTDQNLIIIVPLTTLNDTNYLDLPDGTFITLESEIHDTITSSAFISIAATFLEISKTINNALWKRYNNSSPMTKVNITKCEICNDLDVMGEISTSDSRKMLNMLHLNNLESQMNYNLVQKFTSPSDGSLEMKRIATTNYVTNVTTIYIADQHETISLGSLYKCKNSSHHETHIDAFNPHVIDSVAVIDDDEPIDLEQDYADMNWELKSEVWVAVGLTMSSLGILLCMAILTFIIIRICMDDVLEGNPIGSVIMLLALIAQFSSFFPFTLEYISGDINENSDVMNSMCIIKIFLVTVSYCLTFSLLLSRAIMLASIGSEGGFLSHVNGYIQSIICLFSFFVQLGLSTQLLILLHANSQHMTCMNIYNGNWFWGVIGYDALLLIMLVILSPFIFKSQRNYQEGILIVITSVLCLICWIIWIGLSMIDTNFREITVSLGVQTTAWIVLSSLMVPRCFLIVKSIARSDFTQALPSLTSLAFAQANQFISEPSIYECVNPTVRARSIDNESDLTNLPNEYQSPNDVPTLPLRSNNIRSRNFIEHYNLNFNEIVNPNLPSPNKMTRF